MLLCLPHYNSIFRCFEIKPLVRGEIRLYMYQVKDCPILFLSGIHLERVTKLKINR